MKLSIQDIEHIAELARLDLNEEEKEMYAEQLSVVLDYVQMLGEVDTKGVEETTQVTGLEDIVREDVVERCDKDERIKLLQQFPDRKDNLLKVKAVFEN